MVEEEFDENFEMRNFALYSKKHDIPATKNEIKLLLSLQKIRTLEEEETELATIKRYVVTLRKDLTAEFQDEFVVKNSDLLAKLTSLKQDSGEIKK